MPYKSKAERLAYLRAYKRSEAGKESQRKYLASDTYKEAKRRYQASAASKEARRKFESTEARKEWKRIWRKSEAGKKLSEASKRAYRASPLGKDTERKYRGSEAGKLTMRVVNQRRRGAPGNHTIQDVEACLTMQGYRCFYCLVSLFNGYEVDHMQPISRCGSNNADNIVCACKKCNRTKHAKTFAEFVLGTPGATATP